MLAEGPTSNKSFPKKLRLFKKTVLRLAFILFVIDSSLFLLLCSSVGASVHQLPDDDRHGGTSCQREDLHLQEAHQVPELDRRHHQRYRQDYTDTHTLMFNVEQRPMVMKIHFCVSFKSVCFLGSGCSALIRWLQTWESFYNNLLFPCVNTNINVLLSSVDCLLRVFIGVMVHNILVQKATFL